MTTAINGHRQRHNEVWPLDSPARETRYIGTIILLSQVNTPQLGNLQQYIIYDPAVLPTAFVDQFTQDSNRTDKLVQWGGSIENILPVLLHLISTPDLVFKIENFEG